MEQPDFEIEGSDDSDEDHLEVSPHTTDTEQSDCEDDFSRQAAYRGKDGITQWYDRPVRRGRTCRQERRNIVRHLPGTLGDARAQVTYEEVFDLFFTEDMLEDIVRFTNVYIESVQGNYSRDRDTHTTNIHEVKACIGLLYLGGIMKASHTNLTDLWAADGTGIEYFRLTMSASRFKFLLRALRFDDKSTREERLKTDNLAAVRTMFDRFVDNCKKHYSPSEYVTVDEMLEAFRGRCRFRQYIPSKPAKYGIKIFALVDAKITYTKNLEIYCGKQPEGRYSQSNSGQEVVKRMVAPIAKSGRNVTCDNYFTSVPLAMDLLNNTNLTLVGTIKKNKRELPPITVNVKDRPVGSSLFAFNRDMTLVSYKPKKNKNVLLLSTMHTSDDMDDAVDKPEIVTFYNSTKSGVDTVDQMKSLYNVARITRRWTLVIFFALLNIAGINAYVIQCTNFGQKPPRKDFLKSLSKALVKEHLHARLVCKSLPQSIKLRLKEVLNIQEIPATRDHNEQRRGRCKLCDRKKNRPTKYMCHNGACHKFVCLEHVGSVNCPDCTNCVSYT